MKSYEIVKNELELITQDIEITQKNDELLQGIYETIKNAKSEKTRKEYERTLKSFEAFCNIQNIEAFNYGSVLKFMQYLQVEGRTPSTIKTYFYTLKSIFDTHDIEYTNTHRKIFKDYFKGLVNTNTHKINAKSPILRDRGLKIDDILNHLDTCNKNLKNRKQYKLAIYLAYTGGFRISEVLALTSDDVQVEGLQYYFYVKQGKTGSRTVLINSDELLRSLLEGFTNFEVSYHCVNRLIKITADKMGLDQREFGTHSLRAGFCTSAIMKGFDASQIMNRTGHKSINMLSRYVRIAQDKTDDLRV